VETINWNDWKPSTGTDGNLGAEQVETFTGIGKKRGEKSLSPL